MRVLLRPAELETTAFVARGEPRGGMLDLATGRWTPEDHDGTRLMVEHPWLARVLVEHLPTFLLRFERMVMQRDRDAHFAAALERHEPGAMIPYDALFPGDWDLMFGHEGDHYVAVDHHCPSPTCTCAEIVVELQFLGAERAADIGSVRIDLADRRRPVEASSRPAGELIEKVWARHEATLRRRQTEVRRAFAQWSSSRPREAAAAAAAAAGLPQTAPRGKVGRNEPCPCRSGKKYKRCCGDVSAATSRT